LSIEILLLKDNAGLLAESLEKESLFYVFVKFLSYVLGCFGALGFVMRLCEKFVQPVYQYILSKSEVLNLRINSDFLKSQFPNKKEAVEIDIDEITPIGIEISLSQINHKISRSDTITRHLMPKYSILNNSSHQLESLSTIRRSFRNSISNKVVPVRATI